MKCRYCDREAVYDDGLCESCHRAYEQIEATVMSEQERDSFRGQTVEEDGTVRNEQKVYEERLKEQKRRQSGVHIVTSGLSWRVKLALGFIIFCVISIIIGALGFIIVAMPYLLGAFAVYCVFNIVRAFLRR